MVVLPWLSFCLSVFFLTCLFPEFCVCVISNCQYLRGDLILEIDDMRLTASSVNKSRHYGLVSADTEALEFGCIRVFSFLVVPVECHVLLRVVLLALIWHQRCGDQLDRHV